MIANAAGNYIDNAIAAVDAVLSESTSAAALMQIRHELLRMNEQHDFLPGYGRFLVDQGLDNRELETQLPEVVEWRR